MKKTILFTLASLTLVSSAFAGDGAGLIVKNEFVTGVLTCRPMVQEFIDGVAVLRSWRGITKTTYTICREYVFGAPKRIQILYTETDRSGLYVYRKDAGNRAQAICAEQLEELNARKVSLNDTACRGLPISGEVEELPTVF